METSHSGRDVLPSKILIKEVIVISGIDIENLEFVLIYTVYEKNNDTIVVATIRRISPTPKQIYVKYNWFRQHAGKECFIRKTESDNQKAYILTRRLQDELFVRIRKLICGWQDLI